MAAREMASTKGEVAEAPTTAEGGGSHGRSDGGCARGIGSLHAANRSLPPPPPPSSGAPCPLALDLPKKRIHNLRSAIGPAVPAAKHSRPAVPQFRRARIHRDIATAVPSPRPQAAAPQSRPAAINVDPPPPSSIAAM
eukprot:XP_008671614.1 uncharacterized protein LOC103649041 [Zea mays]